MIINIEKNAVNLLVKEIELKGYSAPVQVEKIFDRINKYYPNTYKIEVSEYGSKRIVKV